MSNYFYKKLFVSVLIVLFFAPLFISAQGGLVPCKGTDCTFCDLIKLVENIVNFLWSLAAVVAGAMLVYGGFIMMTAGGDQGKVKEGKGIITQALIGFIIMFVAWILINLVLSVIATGEVSLRWQCL